MEHPSTIGSRGDDPGRLKKGPSFVHYIYALFLKKYTQKMHLMHLEAEMKTEENLVQNEKKRM